MSVTGVRQTDEQSRSPKRRLRGPQRRERIMQAAREVFTTRDYDGALMGEIAERAGVARPVLYDHFPSKKALLLSILEEESAELLAHIAEPLTAQAGPEERMRRTLEAFFGFIRARPFAWRMLYLDSHVDPEIAETGRRLRELARAQIGAMLGADADRAGLVADSPQRELGVTLIMYALQGATDWWSDHPDTPSEELAATVMSWMWLGLDRLSRGEH